MKRNSKQKQYNSYDLDKIDAILTVAFIANNNCIFVPKRLYKLAKQMIAVKNIKNMSIKTY